MTTLKNREPPLVLAYSSPMKCKLTPEVRHLRIVTGCKRPALDRLHGVWASVIAEKSDVICMT